MQLLETRQAQVSLGRGRLVSLHSSAGVAPQVFQIAVLVVHADDDVVALRYGGLLGRIGHQQGDM
ncbi:hypothetical protein [Pseudomonas fluorescens]|uniref:hypothetical protein n=1 Tax=Pseudomonas fluorescens TaxID=294 RepID=UPI00124039D2|nr:hypothetical protein [Pseudomonas fluorescens]